MQICDNTNGLHEITDGEVLFTGDKLAVQDFATEKDLSDWLELNIESFCDEFLSGDLLEYAFDSDIRKQVFRTPRGKRVDVVVKTTEKTCIIELKNPRTLIDNRHAIGQVLDYGREFPDPKKELIIITTRFDIDTARTIKFYGLPIRYMFVSKAAILEFKGEIDD